MTRSRLVELLFSKEMIPTTFSEITGITVPPEQDRECIVVAVTRIGSYLNWVRVKVRWMDATSAATAISEIDVEYKD